MRKSQAGRVEAMVAKAAAVGGTVMLSLAAMGCQGGEAEEGEVLAHRFPTVRIASQEETEEFCQSWTLGNQEPLRVNAVAMSNQGGFHHANWFYVPEDLYAGEDGTWSCADRGFDQLEAGVAGGVVFAMSTQAAAELQGFPAGAAYLIPPRSKIVGNLHLLNTGDAPLETSMSMELRTIGEEEMTVRLAPLVLAYEDLAIPPMSRSRVRASCDFATAYGKPLDFKFYYVLPHYHALGVGAFFDATMAGGDQAILTRSARIGDVLSQTLDPPFDANGATDLVFGCEYQNPTSETVGWGLGSQEMCLMVAWQDSGYSWVGGLLDGSAPVEAGEDGVQTFEGPCQVGFLELRD